MGKLLAWLKKFKIQLLWTLAIGVWTVGVAYGNWGATSKAEYQQLKTKVDTHIASDEADNRKLNDRLLIAEQGLDHLPEKFAELNKNFSDYKVETSKYFAELKGQNTQLLKQNEQLMEMLKNKK